MQEEDRLFLDSESVSLYLFCSICTNIFRDPLRLVCGHTFCERCIVEWGKKTMTCPQCRERFSLKTCSKDFLAYNLVMEMKVKCKYPGCVWVGPLSDLAAHEEKCLFHPDRVETWMVPKLSGSSQSGILRKLYERNPNIARSLAAMDSLGYEEWISLDGEGENASPAKRFKK